MTMGRFDLVAGGAVLLAAAGLAYAFWYSSKLEEETKKAVAAQARLGEEKQQRYLNVLRQSLRDPGSAQVQNLRFVSGKGGEALCGDINAKNAFGGYVGMKPFAVTERQMDDEPSRVIVSRDSSDLLTETNVFDKIGLVNAGCLKRLPAVR